MAIKKFKFAKLVRDNIVSGIQTAGNKPVFKILNIDEYKLELLKKLAEESNELGSASKEELLGELADLQEIIDNLLDAVGISRQELTDAQIKKNLKAGSFKNMHYIDYVEAEEESEWGRFYLKNSHKYPEIK